MIVNLSPETTGGRGDVKVTITHQGYAKHRGRLFTADRENGAR